MLLQTHNNTHFKGASKNLANELKTMGLDLSHSATLNLLSKSLGYENYNTYKDLAESEKVVEALGNLSKEHELLPNLEQDGEKEVFNIYSSQILSPSVSLISGPKTLGEIKNTIFSKYYLDKDDVTMGSIINQVYKYAKAIAESTNVYYDASFEEIEKIGITNENCVDYYKKCFKNKLPARDILISAEINNFLAGIEYALTLCEYCDFDMNSIAGYAVKTDNLSLLEFLINRNLNLKHNDHSLIGFSYGLGKFNFVEKLLSIGDNLTKGAYQYALMVAAGYKNINIIKKIRDKGFVDLGFREGELLSHSIFSKDLAIIEYLLDYGIDINSDGGRPIHNAVFANNLEMVKYLKNNGARLDLTCDGKTLEEVAIERDSTEILNYLKPPSYLLERKTL